MVSFRRFFPFRCDPIFAMRSKVECVPRNRGASMSPWRIRSWGNPEKKRDSVSYRLYIYIYRIYLYTYKNVIWSDWGEIVCAKKLWKNIIPILMKTWRLDRILVFWWCHTRCLRTRFQQELMQKIENRWWIWAVSKAFGYLLYLGVIIQPSYIGIIIRHDKDPYEPLSIMECHIADFGLLGDDATSAIRSSRQSARDYMLEKRCAFMYIFNRYMGTHHCSRTYIMHVHL